MQSSLEIACP